MCEPLTSHTGQKSEFSRKIQKEQNKLADWAKGVINSKKEVLHHNCVAILERKSKMSRNHGNSRCGLLEAKKLATEGMSFVAGETIRNAKKGNAVVAETRPENNA